MIEWTDPVFDLTFRFTYSLEGAVWEFAAAAVLILAVLLLRAVVKKRFSARIPEEYVQEATEESVLFSDRGLGLSIRQLRGLTQLRRVMMIVYLAGAGTVAVFLLAVNLVFRIRLRRRRQPMGNYQGRPVYVAEGLTSPCLVGLFRPAIYLTPEVLADEAVRSHVLAHEYTHFRHGDHIWTVLWSLCLVKHWYHPLVWVAASQCRRDRELACDEGAVAALGEG